MVMVKDSWFTMEDPSCKPRVEHQLKLAGWRIEHMAGRLSFTGGYPGLMAKKPLQVGMEMQHLQNQQVS